MKENRDMFYSDFQTGGYINPYNNPNMMNGFMQQPNMNNAMYYDNTNYMENRILKLERQVKRLESRVTRLENLSGNSIDDFSSTNDMYMI